MRAITDLSAICLLPIESACAKTAALSARLTTLAELQRRRVEKEESETESRNKVQVLLVSSLFWLFVPALILWLRLRGAQV